MANALTLVRLALVLPFAYLIVLGVAPEVAALVFSVAIASDLLDGRIARARGTASDVGRALDHGTDFLFVDVGLFAAAWRGAIPWLLPVLVAIAFAQYVVDSYFLHRAGQLRMSSLGRWNGILYFVPLGGVLLCDFGMTWLRGPNRLVAWALCASTLVSIADRALSLRRVTRQASGN